MILGYWGLSLNILSIIFVSLSASLIFISVTIYFISNSLNRFQANTKIGILWCIGILPWVISLFSVILLMLPELTSNSDSLLSTFVHWHHVYQFEILSWHGASIGVFCIVFFSVCLTKIVKAVKANAQLNQLDFFIQNTNSKQHLTVIESEESRAFTSGLFSPRSYITSGLSTQLTSQEATIVAEHELAHARSYDPLRKYGFSLLAAFFPMSIAQQLNSDFSLALEQAADESVLPTVSDETIIAKTLLKVSSLGQRPISSMPLSNCHFSTHPLTLRIEYLLNDNKGQSFPILLFFSFSITLALLSTLSVDLLHHALERLFSH
ncbi:MAG: beta-lactamase regulating signal transducer with metallopeptidase domain [Flavobacteriales bacterium]|jgi:beta-lactamase regulating signal transducer with metallopeptidase domain